MQFDLAMTDAPLSTTRAVRKRLDLDRPVPREVIRECIALSQQAPTGSNTQGWRWIIVDDADKRAKLGEIYKQAGAAYLAAGAEATKGQGQQGRVMSSALWLAENMARCRSWRSLASKARFRKGRRPRWSLVSMLRSIRQYGVSSWRCARADLARR